METIKLIEELQQISIEQSKTIEHIKLVIDKIIGGLENAYNIKSKVVSN